MKKAPAQKAAPKAAAKKPAAAGKGTTAAKKTDAKTADKTKGISILNTNFQHLNMTGTQHLNMTGTFFVRKIQNLTLTYFIENSVLKHFN